MDGFWQAASTRDQEIDLAIVADDELCHTLLPSNDTGSDRGGGGDDDDGTWVRLAAKHAVPGVSRIETRLHAFEGDLVRDGQAQLPRVVLLAGQEARHVHHATQVYYAAHAAATQDGEFVNVRFYNTGHLQHTRSWLASPRDRTPYAMLLRYRRTIDRLSRPRAQRYRLWEYDAPDEAHEVSERFPEIEPYLCDKSALEDTPMPVSKYGCTDELFASLIDYRTLELLAQRAAERTYLANERLQLDVLPPSANYKSLEKYPWLEHGVGVVVREALLDYLSALIRLAGDIARLRHPTKARAGLPVTASVVDVQDAVRLLNNKATIRSDTRERVLKLLERIYNSAADSKTPTTTTATSSAPSACTTTTTTEETE